MRIGLMFLMLMCSLAGWSYAATINLTDGRSVTGDITKKDAKSLQISVDGVTMTYYADEIKDIDGKSFSDQQALKNPPAAPLEQPPAADNSVGSGASAAGTGTMDQEKKALILKFVDVFGTRQALTNNFELMIKQIAKEKPDEAQKIRQRVKVDEIIDRLIPIYDRNFSTEDLKAFIDFYGSEKGQKLISTIPELMKESVGESVKYMQEKFPEVKNGK